MVKLIKTSLELIQERNAEKLSIGFVPTMGNLHAGHISLLQEALKHNDVVYFSIFVNPKQFGPNEDFNKYPRTLQDDIDLIEQCLNSYTNKKVIIFAPTDAKEIYPLTHNHVVSVYYLANLLEGALRPGHFDGVATVVLRLFELVRPHKAYFGLKDYQQYLVIQQMAKDLALPIEIIGMPIVRESTGLALSSRNQYLTAIQREEALILSQTLVKIAKMIDHKKSNLEKAQKEIRDILKDPRWNYLELRDAATLSLDLTHSTKITMLAVFQLGTTRLLDNMQQEIQ